MLLICGIIVVFLLGSLLTKVSHSRNPSISCPYECGFFPHKTPVTYSIGFYTAGLSFMIFDGELLFISPFLYSNSFAGTVSFAAVAFFLVMLSLMFCYELCSESLWWC